MDETVDGDIEKKEALEVERVYLCEGDSAWPLPWVQQMSIAYIHFMTCRDCYKQK
jgi:hypothetical protein